MKLFYKELYGTSQNSEAFCFPSLELHYTDNEKHILPNLKPYLADNEDLNFNIGYLVFSYGLFNSLSESTINKLKSILDFADRVLSDKMNSYINKDVWKPFLFTSNINLKPIRKTINSNISTVTETKSKHRLALLRKYYKDENQLNVKKYYSVQELPFDESISKVQTELFNILKENLVSVDKLDVKNPKLKPKYKLTFPYNIDIPNISIMKEGFFGGVLSIDYEIEFDNELDLLYSFLDCLFSSEYNFNIKKCNSCNNFFITLKTDKRHCSPCETTIIKSRKTAFESSNIRKLERKINSLYNSPYKSSDDKRDYLKNKKKVKADFSHDEVSLKNWYLNHYATEEARKRNDYTIE